MHSVCRTGCLLLTVALIATVLPPVNGEAASSRKCITKTCRPLKRQCISRFKGEFRTAKKACREASSRKPCKKAKKRAFKQNREACTNGFKSCKRCCRTDQVGCNIVNCGDGVRVQGEECDDGNLTDGDGCSARCEAEARLIACRRECKSGKGDCMSAAHLVRTGAREKCKAEKSRSASLCETEQEQCEHDVSEAFEQCTRKAKKCKKRARKGFERCHEATEHCRKETEKTHSLCKNEVSRTYEQHKEGCKDAYDECRSNCEDYLTPYRGCPPNEALGPNLLTVTVAKGGDLDVGWTGFGHNQGVVAGMEVFGCLQDCDTDANPVCTGTGPIGEGSLNGTTLGPPLPLLVADVGTCVTNEFTEDLTIRTLNLQAGEIEMRVKLKSIVHLTWDKQTPCPTCSGETIGAVGRCRGLTYNFGKSCTTEGITAQFGNTSSDCLPFPSDNAGELEIVLDPITSGIVARTADIPCVRGACPCSGGFSGPPAMNECDDPFSCSEQVCLDNGGSDDVRKGIKAGVDQQCCKKKREIIPCFTNVISRTGESIPGEPAWPDPTYPKSATGRVAGVFCIPPTNSGTINIATGLEGPSAFVVPVETHVDFSP